MYISTWLRTERKPRNIPVGARLGPFDLALDSNLATPLSDFGTALLSPYHLNVAMGSTSYL